MNSGKFWAFIIALGMVLLLIAGPAWAAKKVLFIDSYHTGYEKGRM